MLNSLQPLPNPHANAAYAGKPVHRQLRQGAVKDITSPSGGLYPQPYTPPQRCCTSCSVVMKRFLRVNEYS
ncbi:hypothetical protein H6G76_03400 [Nostoc sp. FACHB-152]|uniref:hypothetical protein n=1 Tax=unclassified Nostoc TaxID=2593658 RepID=UPI0016850B7F|nr:MULTISPECIES: hypothetical protein [unclassified Nostoc]MBD2446217.1 hypothetical protein [Nostoc sp. FACHB-152]MBD2469487.1 hypothetical protein [Nostoc sp. FACHB-145]